MSNKHRPQPKTPSTMPTRKYRAVMLEPPVEIARTPPPVVTDVNVNGEFECARVDFYYLPTDQFMEAYFNGEGVTRRAGAEPEYGTLRIPPVARVALPLQVSLDLILKILEMYAESGRSLKSYAPELFERFQRAAADLASLGVSSAPSASPGQELAREDASEGGEP